MILRRIGPLSVAKLSGVLYAIFGLVFGAVVSLASLAASLVNSGRDPGPFAALFGGGAVIWLPLFYGCVGFLGSLIMAALYNVIAGWVGGITIELDVPAGQNDAFR